MPHHPQARRIAELSVALAQHERNDAVRWRPADFADDAMELAAVSKECSRLSHLFFGDDYLRSGQITREYYEASLGRLHARAQHLVDPYGLGFELLVDTSAGMPGMRIHGLPDYPDGLEL